MKTTFKIILMSFVCPAYLTVNAGDNNANHENHLFSLSSQVPKSPGKDKEKMIKGGFFFHLDAFFPSKNYMFPPVGFGDNDSGEKFGIGTGFDLGNMFRITNFNQKDKALGIRASWLSTGLTKMTIDDTTGLRAIYGSVARVGPYFTYKINDMAFDGFFQIGPSYSLLLDQDWNSIDFVGALGFTHELGVTYRYNVLSVGTSYRFGRIKDADNFTEKVNKDMYQFRTSNLRFFVGIKI